jgi:helicase
MTSPVLPEPTAAPNGTAPALHFPLYDRAQHLGVLDGHSALIIAPTATGKSYIGREAIRRAIDRKAKETHAYLVPYRALAEEVHDAFAHELSATDARIRISTGDHRDPLRPEEAELIVATYESFAAVLQRSAFRPGTIVADEIHLIADHDRGPGVEGLFARLLSRNHMGALCALSAVIQNGKDLAEWLGVPLLEGTLADRPVPLKLEHELARDLDEALQRRLHPCTNGERALVFCNSPSKPIRRHIEQAFRDKLIRVIASTPTLAAGVNLPADIVVVRDVFRGDTVRGTFRQVLIPSGEVLNMLGRAGRPHQVEAGTGVALIHSNGRRHAEIEQLTKAVEAGKGGDVESRLPESFEGIMRFVLATKISCTCPAASQFYRGQICKHQACAIHDLLFEKNVPAETRQRAIYVCGHVFSRTLDSGTLLDQALQVLEAWGLLERVAVAWRATPLGKVASGSGFDLLLVHQAAQRVKEADPCDYPVVAHWAVDDYIAEEKDQARWHEALGQWLDEVDAHKFKLPTRYRGDFERRLEDLSRVCLLYEKAAKALGKEKVAAAAREAEGAVRYGVAPPLVPLMALGFAQLGRARSRFLYEKGIRTLQDLASADPVHLADPRRAPVAVTRAWVDKAREIHNARAVARADGQEADQEFDELVSRFRLDPAALR